MAKIKAPNKQYNGISASVPFINGEGETNNPHLIEWFKENGYIVEETQNKALQETLLGEEVNNTTQEEKTTPKPKTTPRPQPKTTTKK